MAGFFEWYVAAARDDLVCEAGRVTKRGNSASLGLPAFKVVIRKCAIRAFKVQHRHHAK